MAKMNSTASVSLKVGLAVVDPIGVSAFLPWWVGLLLSLLPCFCCIYHKFYYSCILDDEGRAEKDADDLTEERKEEIKNEQVQHWRRIAALFSSCLLGLLFGFLAASTIYYELAPGFGSAASKIVGYCIWLIIILGFLGLGLVYDNMCLLETSRWWSFTNYDLEFDYQTFFDESDTAPCWQPARCLGAELWVAPPEYIAYTEETCPTTQKSCHQGFLYFSERRCAPASLDRPAPISSCG